jgi:transcriptional regulator with XRE-family HTH domain
MLSPTWRMIVTAVRVAVELSELSQAEVARRCYVSPSHLCQGLTLKKHLSIEVLDKVMDVLGLELVVTVRRKTFYDGKPKAVAEPM